MFVHVVEMWWRLGLLSISHPQLTPALAGVDITWFKEKPYLCDRQVFNTLACMQKPKLIRRMFDLQAVAPLLLCRA